MVVSTQVTYLNTWNTQRALFPGVGKHDDIGFSLPVIVGMQATLLPAFFCSYGSAEMRNYRRIVS